MLDGPPELFTQNLIRETQEARQQLVDLQARHEDCKKMENSLRELCNLFMVCDIDFCLQTLHSIFFELMVIELL